MNKRKAVACGGRSVLIVPFTPEYIACVEDAYCGQWKDNAQCVAEDDVFGCEINAGPSYQRRLIRCSQDAYRRVRRSAGTDWRGPVAALSDIVPLWRLSPVSRISPRRGILVYGAVDPARRRIERGGMQTAKIVYWEEDGSWIGYLQEFPDYWTQGDTLEDLESHLRDLYADLASGDLPGIRRVADIAIA